MERTRTWLVAAAVAGLAAIAVVDAVVGGGEPRRARPTTTEASEQSRLATEALRSQSVYGTLVYADRECVVHAVRLPDLGRLERETDAPTGERGCRFTMSPGGSFGVGSAAPRPGSPLVAVCASGAIAVGTDDGTLVGRAPGCPPAWKPNGDLTAVHEGEVVDVAFSPRGTLVRPPRALVSGHDLRRQFARPPWAFPDAAVLEAAWLDDERVALIVRDRRTGEHALAVVEDGRVVGGPPFPYARLSALRASPRGTYVAARIGTSSGIVVVDRNGELVSFPFRAARAIAWSPDEVWTAAATRDAIYVFETGERPSRFARLPIAARDVAWR